MVNLLRHLEVALIALALSAALGCEKNRTEIVLGMATDMGAPVPLASVTMQIENLLNGYPVGSGQPQTFPVPGQIDQPYELPATFAVYSANGSADRFRAVLSAADSTGKILVVRSGVMNLVPEKTLFVRLGIVSACQGMADVCGDGQTCIDGQCKTEDVDSTLLPPYTSGMEHQVECAGATTFVDTSTKQPLTIIGTSCGTGTCLEGVCLATAKNGGDAGLSGTGGAAGMTGAGGLAGMRGAGGAGGTTSTGGTSGTGGSSGAASSVHVVGNQIYDGTEVIRLMGVNRPGGEHSCVNANNAWDPADGSGNNQATITTMLSWKINAVRIPLNEDCWLNLNGVKLGGASYQSQVQTWVNLLLQNDIYPILDLDWSENNGAEATGEQPMPDAANAPAFWGQVAAAYQNSPKVIFDLFSEPYPDNNMEATAAWTCWRDGGTCTGISYQVAGMQSMLTAVRNAGATNLILLAGIEYANDLSQWMTYKPTDPANNFAASWHVYPNSNYTGNHTLMMDASGVAGIAPIVATEIGGPASSCTATGGSDDGSFITSVMSYLDGLSPPQGYMAWAWSTDDTPVLISSYNGTAVCSGLTYQNHLLTTPH